MPNSIIAYRMCGIVALFLSVLATMTLLFYLLRCAEQAASGKNVLTTAGANGGEHTVIREIVAEILYVAVVGSLKVNVGNGVESYEIETTFESLNEFYDFASVGSRVVHAFEHDVLERQATLVSEIVIAHEVDHFND